MPKEPIIYHKCPNCGFILDDLQFKYAMWDYHCPKCNMKKLSSFWIIKQDA